ncbi:MAG: type III-B CRISPR-associated protein Cas10/Cmr2 [Gammaproteobacteria bacterium]
MSNYLIVIAIGPVQGFIAAARRTRDLWKGSESLSNISKAVARSLHDDKATLLFPSPQALTASDGGVANKVLAVANAPDAAAIQMLIDNAKQAARRRLCEEAMRLESAVKPSDAVDWEELARQLDDLLELYAAWVKVSDGEHGHCEAYQRLERLLAGRKATRDFRPAAVSAEDPRGFNHRKSSFDAARESVLTAKADPTFRRKFGIDANEELDAPGLIKRVLGRDEDFESVPRVALEPWLQAIGRVDDQEVNKKARVSLKAIRQYFQALRELNLGLATHSKDLKGEMPYDGQLLFADRLDSEIDEWQSASMSGRQDAGTVIKTLRDVEIERRKLFSVLKEHVRPAEPIPYVAIIQADGDGMGRYLWHLASQKEHEQVSGKLADFSREVRKVVKTHRGICVYTGGDDLLAFCSVQHAIACAAELREEFVQTIKKCPEPGDGVPKPTLTVGVGIGHVLTPLVSLRALASEAERLGKQGGSRPPFDDKRDALGIVIQPRSGAPLHARGQWSEKTGDLCGFHTRLCYWIDAFAQDRLSDSAAYELGRHVRRTGSDPVLAYALFSRLIVRKTDSRADRPATEQLIGETYAYIKAHRSSDEGVSRLCEEWLVARWFATHSYINVPSAVAEAA